MCNYAIHKKQKRYVSSIIEPITYSMVCLYNTFKFLLTNKNKLTQYYLKWNSKDMNEKVLKIHNLLHNNSLALSVAHNLKKLIIGIIF